MKAHEKKSAILLFFFFFLACGLTAVGLVASYMESDSPHEGSVWATQQRCARRSIAAGSWSKVF